MDAELREEDAGNEAGSSLAETPPDKPDPALLEGLRLLDNSQSLIRTIFLGLSLQYHSLDLQRCLLKLQAENPEAVLAGPQPREVQTAASLITMCALFGFQRQAEQLACQEALAGGCPDTTDVTLGAVIILVALIRLARLNAPVSNSFRAGERPEELEELVEITEEPDF